jgi:DNA-binding PadR family transcriptional regulator
VQDLRKGSTALLALQLLDEEPMYGFQLIEALRARTGGVLNFAEGMLYPMLHKLERDGLLEGDWRPSLEGPPRKYYRVTDAGRRELERRRRDWTEFSAAVDAALDARRRGGAGKVIGKRGAKGRAPDLAPAGRTRR